MPVAYSRGGLRHKVTATRRICARDPPRPHTFLGKGL